MRKWTRKTAFESCLAHSRCKSNMLIQWEMLEVISGAKFTPFHPSPTATTNTTNKLTTINTNTMMIKHHWQKHSDCALFIVFSGRWCDKSGAILTRFLILVLRNNFHQMDGLVSICNCLQVDQIGKQVKNCNCLTTSQFVLQICCWICCSKSRKQLSNQNFRKLKAKEASSHQGRDHWFSSFITLN
jgi:hypothetical protein